MSRVSETTVRVPGRGVVRARHEWGSMYVDLYFGYEESPYETINMGNGEGYPPDVRTVVTAWVKEMDSDPSWPTWYEDTLAAIQQ